MARAWILSLVAAAASTTAGCVAPVGPKWSDPDRNYPPSLVEAIPPVGTFIGLGADGGTHVEVSVTLADQNTQDNLYLHWIIDYPPYSPDNTVVRSTIKPGGASVERTPESFAPDCAADGLSRTLSEHRLMLAVSDRPFGDDPTKPDQVSAAGNYLLEAVWPFVLNCH
jgi:hypothetical protein